MMTSNIAKRANGDDKDTTGDLNGGFFERAKSNSPEMASTDLNLAPLTSSTRGVDNYDEFLDASNLGFFSADEGADLQGDPKKNSDISTFDAATFEFDPFTFPVHSEISGKQPVSVEVFKGVTSHINQFSSCSITLTNFMADIVTKVPLNTVSALCCNRDKEVLKGHVAGDVGSLFLLCWLDPNVIPAVKMALEPAYTEMHVATMLSNIGAYATLLDEQIDALLSMPKEQHVSQAIKTESYVRDYSEHLREYLTMFPKQGRQVLDTVLHLVLKIVTAKTDAFEAWVEDHGVLHSLTNVAYDAMFSLKEAERDEYLDAQIAVLGGIQRLADQLPAKNTRCVHRWSQLSYSIKFGNYFEDKDPKDPKESGSDDDSTYYEDIHQSFEGSQDDDGDSSDSTKDEDHDQK